MKILSVLLSLLGLVLTLSAAEEPEAKKPYVLYAQFLQDTQVELSDGAVWLMDKGDCFPVYMFKEHQTKVILQLASATFLVDAERLKVLPDTQNAAALESYRKNIAQYLNGRPDVWRNEMIKKKKEGSGKMPAKSPGGAAKTAN